jgi:hypothetical protein
MIDTMRAALKGMLQAARGADLQAGSSCRVPDQFGDLAGEGGCGGR